MTWKNKGADSFYHMPEITPSRALEAVLADAARHVTPTKAEEKKLERVTSLVNSRLVKQLDEERRRSASIVTPELSLGGSYAKGTWLKGSADIDFFLLYPSSYGRESLERDAVRVARESVKEYTINMRFAEHPYVETFVEGVRVNLVPCYKVKKGEWQSAADRSPFHTEYIKSKFDEKLKLETRLLKRFVKNAGVYGAEVKIQGFSGYVCEVLALKYGSFENVLKGLSTSALGQVVSVDETYDKDLVSSFKSPLVILDPVDSTRNLGSAVSPENVAKLVLRSRRFLANPSKSDLRERRKGNSRKFSDVQILRKKKSDLLSRTIVVTFPTEKRSVDILWGQLKKSAKSLSSKLSDYGFGVIRKSVASNEESQSAFIFVLAEKKIGSFQVKAGPEYFRAQEIQRYLEKNKGRSVLTWIGEEGRILSLAERDPSNSEIMGLLETLLPNPRKLEKLGLSKAIRNEISKKYKIETGESLLSEKHVLKNKEWLVDAVLEIILSEPVIS